VLWFIVNVAAMQIVKRGASPSTGDRQGRRSPAKKRLGRGEGGPHGTAQRRIYALLKTASGVYALFALFPLFWMVLLTLNRTRRC
jgi:hypothetical protein